MGFSRPPPLLFSASSLLPAFFSSFVVFPGLSNPPTSENVARWYETLRKVSIFGMGFFFRPLSPRLGSPSLPGDTFGPARELKCSETAWAGEKREPCPRRGGKASRWGGSSLPEAGRGAAPAAAAPRRMVNGPGRQPDRWPPSSRG